MAVVDESRTLPVKLIRYWRLHDDRSHSATRVAPENTATRNGELEIKTQWVEAREIRLTAANGPARFYSALIKRGKFINTPSERVCDCLFDPDKK